MLTSGTHIMSNKDSYVSRMLTVCPMTIRSVYKCLLSVFQHKLKSEFIVDKNCINIMCDLFVAMKSYPIMYNSVSHLQITRHQ